MRKLLYTYLILSLSICSDVFANEYISPVKDLDLEFELNIDDYTFENYRGFILNIEIPNTEYIDFENIEVFELNQNDILNNVFWNDGYIEVKNIDSIENKFKLRVSTDYKSTMPEYVEAVNNDKCIYVNFNLTATERLFESLDSDGNTDYFWNYTDELIYSSEGDNPSISAVKLQFINVPIICLD